jgi:hypothetical protein
MRCWQVSRLSGRICISKHFCCEVLEQPAAPTGYWVLATGY